MYIDLLNGSSSAPWPIKNHRLLKLGPTAEINFIQTFVRHWICCMRWMGTTNWNPTLFIYCETDPNRTNL